jgi:hypothetical protein
MSLRIVPYKLNPYLKIMLVAQQKLIDKNNIITNNYRSTG